MPEKKKKMYFLQHRYAISWSIKIKIFSQYYGTSQIFYGYGPIIDIPLLEAIYRCFIFISDAFHFRRFHAWREEGERDCVVTIFSSPPPKGKSWAVESYFEGCASGLVLGVGKGVLWWRKKKSSFILIRRGMRWKTRY